MVNHKYKFVYIHIPKSAGTFMSKYLGGNIPGTVRKNLNGDGHMGLKAMGKLINNDYDGYYKFTTVRNPWDWYVSLYEYVKNRKAHEWRLFGGDTTNFKEWLYKLTNCVIEDDVIEKFKDDHTSTATLYKSIKQSNLDCGWMTHRYIYSGAVQWLKIFKSMSMEEIADQIDELVIFDDVLSQSDIADDFVNKCGKAINCDPHLIEAIRTAKKFKVRKGRKPYIRYYDKETRNWVAEKESLLISKFGYEYGK